MYLAYHEEEDEENLYHDEDDTDLEQEYTCCFTGCFECLDISWRDFF
jgi:hypothetical protein